MTDWVALLPVVLTDTEKRGLEKVEQFGSYYAGALWSEIDPDSLNDLERRDLLRTYRERRGGPTIYAVTELGSLWLKGCRRAEEADEQLDLLKTAE